MIIVENIEINGRAFTRTYSDEGRYVVREGISYEEAVDPASFNRVYTEGEIIQYDDGEMRDDAELTDDEVAAILMGGSL